MKKTFLSLKTFTRDVANGGSIEKRHVSGLHLSFLYIYILEFLLLEHGFRLAEKVLIAFLVSSTPGSHLIHLGRIK